MAFVTDIVEGTILAMENDRAVGEIINIGNDEEMSVIEAARLIHTIADTGHDLKLTCVPFESVFGKYKDIMRRIPDLTKAEMLLGYKPKITTETAIRITIDEVKKSIPC
jgi:UDP-glucose 4-epimerase